MIDQLSIFKGLPFYCEWSDKSNSVKRCCFNHTMGLPRKDGNEYPLCDYELDLYNALAEYKHIWVKKASGLGITEFILRYMTWLCLKDGTYRGSQFPIITGPNQDMAIKLIKRVKNMFEPLGILFDSL